MSGNYRFAVAAVLMLGVSAMAGASIIIPIDTFTAGNPDLEQKVTGTTDVTETGLSGVIGSQRYTSLQVVTAGTGNEDSCSANIGSGVMNLNSDVGFEGVWELHYGDGADLNQNFGASVGNDRVQLEWTGGTLAGAVVELTLVSDNGGVSAKSQTLSKTTVTGSQLMEYMFADFDQIDFTDIDRVQLRIEGPISWDGAMKSGTFIVVPEPATLAVVGLGGVALLMRRRKRLA